ncbi:hypothetical protein [Methylobacterium oxalidis]|uniref:DUF308 domain-containing protein n=1 Tax=Methylobacterium oxalidis TaxID=944322 RepID=A0A512J3E7_9HYPH|nr:hypothetical protein [Methylobacterium oxalidis]GEP04507.1 hypothetical protein MOX02_25450 [Methylobacterium oxalidis]GJE35365.1 hypothetical protein LDDCCGHA_5583 [Methylobacterium oxalidis]GLS64786.1 hypothetical protein GCM10007888_31670 [Methylobacterium oxalidis]
MIVALIALAVAMMIGGTASVIQGFPFVRLESGLAMVIAGATVASAGAVIAGLAVVADRIRRVERALALDAAAPAVHDFGVRPRNAPAFAADAFAPRPEPAVPDLLRGRPALAPEAAPIGGAALAGLAAGTILSSGRTTLPPLGAEAQGHGTGAEHRAEPALAEPAPAEPDLPEPALHEPELPLPEPEQPGESGLVAARREPTFEPEPAPQPDDGISPEDDLFAGPAEPSPETRAPEPRFDEAGDIALRPTLQEPSTGPEGEAERPGGAPDAETAAGEPSEPAPPREIVGTHASGGNTYVMYADGSIEAETPQGRFTFNSLDELKAFVDSGGEGQTRGAA